MIIPEALCSVPPRKLTEALEHTIRSCAKCSQNSDAQVDRGACERCLVINKAIHRYADANIPVRYWPLEMERDFTGDVVLLNKYKEIKEDLQGAYRSGLGLCFAGLHGCGKSFLLCSVLKRASEKGFSSLYTTLSDIVSSLLSKDTDERANVRKTLVTIDFLVIDEFDPRFMNTEKSSDLFGKMLEDVFRTRHQNCLPTLMATNSPNVVESFTGPIKESISSLMGCVKIIPVLGQDFRKKKD